MKAPAHLPSVSRRRKLVGLAAALTLGLSAALIPAMSSGVAAGPFEIDGIVPGTPVPTVLPDPSGATKELGPLNSSSTKIGVIHNAPLPALGLTNPNGQVDLRQAWLKTGKDGGTGDDWLYFAWERDANSGSGFIAYEFMKDAAPVACAYDTATAASLTNTCNPWKNRNGGDFILLWDQQGGSKDLYVRTWSGVKPNLVLGAPVLLTAAQGQAAYSADGFRGEAAINLTTTVFGGSKACRSFANTIPSTVTGNSDSADYKDTILKQAPPISNCTSTTTTVPKQGDGVTAIPNEGLALGANGTTVTDTATVGLVGGTATPAGSVKFYLCKVDLPGVCDTGGDLVAPAVALSGTSYPVTVTSPVATVTEPGRYCWRAEFSGDPANGIPGSSDSTLATECFVIQAVPVSLTTTQTWVPNDSATLTAPAGGNLAGSVTFTLYRSADCSGTSVYTTTVPVSGTSPQTVGTSNTTAQTTSGSFSWKVSYNSTNAAQKPIAASCQETSGLTVTNGGTVTSS
ncbi:MAG: hypothetical protein NTV23_06915 [Propionibacteriales bacterium]|nr:hypothetical protein [Propionibacteriales bacterium]